MSPQPGPVAGPRRRPADLALTVAAVLGVVCAVVVLAGPLFGVRMLVFRSGSMAPTITAGSLALAVSEPVGQARVGDVVAVLEADGSRVTHRVVKRDGGVLTLRGDANSADDPQTYSPATVDRVVAHVPAVGYGVAWATSPIGLLLLAAGILLLAASATGRRTPTHRAEKPRAARSRTRTRARTGVTTCLVLTTVVGLGVLGPGQVRPGWAAAWKDPVAITGATYTAVTVPKPTITGCAVTGVTQKTATITFAVQSTPYAFAYTATLVETGQSVVIGGSGASRQVAFNAGLLSTVLNQTYNVRITASLPAPNGSWESVSANQPVTIQLLGLGMSCGTAT